MLIVDIKVNNKKIDTLKILNTGETSGYNKNVFSYKIIEPEGGYWNEISLAHNRNDSYLDLLSLALKSLKRFGYFDQAKHKWSKEIKKQQTEQILKIMKEMDKLNHELGKGL